MSTIAQIEDQLIATLDGLGLISLVDSMGRKAPPLAMKYPAVFVYFAGDKSDRSVSRPVVQLAFETLVVVKNLKSESAAASDAYTLIDAVRGAINGKRLGFTDIEPLVNTARDIADYQDGIISYLLRFETRQYLPVVTE